MTGRPTWIKTRLMSYSPDILVKTAPRESVMTATGNTPRMVDLAVSALFF